MRKSKMSRSSKTAADFGEMLRGMLDLVAQGRGIELLLRLADQVREASEVARSSYATLMDSPLKIPNLHPPQTLPRLFPAASDREQVELARDIADKLAHGLYREARIRIDKYSRTYTLRATLQNDPIKGWHIKADGHLIEEDGRYIDRIEDWVSTSPDNLMFEEYEVFVANGYSAAAKEIFRAAWNSIASVQPALANDISHLRRFRSLKRGKRYYSKPPNLSDSGAA